MRGSAPLGFQPYKSRVHPHLSFCAQAELKLDREAADATLSLVQDALKELNDISNAVSPTL